MKRVILAALLICAFTGKAQGLLGKVKDKVSGKSGKIELFEDEKLDSELYKKYVGKIVFANSTIEREDPESKYITSYTLGDKLYFRGYFANSVSNNILIELGENGKKPKEINEMKKSGFDEQTRLITYLYIDDQFIASTGDDKHLSKDLATQKYLSMRLMLNDGTDEFWEGEILYQKMLSRPELLTPGKHKLRLLQAPTKTFGLGSDIKFKPMAEGIIEMTVPKDLKVNESDCFPKKRLTDPKLEAEVLKAVKTYFKDGAPTAFKSILTDAEVTIIRDDYGNIVKKSFIAAIVNKNAANEVWYTYYIFDKMWDGKAYLPAHISESISLNGHTAPEGKQVNPACLKFLK